MDNDIENTETFVGTLYYVSPEMVNSKIAGPFTDLWALGVILCHMITGKIPWDLSRNVFQQIIDRDLALPSNMPKDARDLVEKIMHINPLKRLGAGASGTPFGMDALKSHKFFEGINFEAISS